MSEAFSGRRATIVLFAAVIASVFGEARSPGRLCAEGERVFAPHGVGSLKTSVELFRRIKACHERLRQNPRYLSGMITRVTEWFDVGARSGASRTSGYVAQFWRSDDRFRIDYLRPGFSGGRGDIEQDDIAAIRIIAGGKTFQLLRGGPETVCIQEYDDTTNEIAAALAGDLRYPLESAFRPGELAVSDMLQRPDVSLSQGERFVVVRLDKKDSAGRLQSSLSLDLDPAREYAICGAIARGGRGASSYVVEAEVTLGLLDGAYVVTRRRETESFGSPPAPKRRITYEFSELSDHLFSDAVFSLESLRSLAPESMTLRVAADGTEKLVDHRTSPAPPQAGQTLADGGRTPPRSWFWLTLITLNGALALIIYLMFRSRAKQVAPGIRERPR